MNNAQKNNKHLKPILLILGILVLTRLAFIVIMPHTYSKDLFAWLDVMEILKKGGNPYADSGVLNWPPFWMQLLFFISNVAKATSLSPILLIQTTLVLGEATVVVVCYAIVSKFYSKSRTTTALIVSLAINPVCILLNCQHCNFDVFVGLWVLLFTYALLTFHENKSEVNWLAACFFLGMGILTKTVPFVLSPLLLAGIPKQNKGTVLFGSLLLFFPVIIGMSIIYTLAPLGVAQHVLGYRSMAGWYGISGIFNVCALPDAICIYSLVSPYLISCLMLAVALKAYKTVSLTPSGLITAMLTLLVFVPTFGPGYSPPYILWFLPILTIYYFTAPSATRKVMVAGYCILILTYTIEYCFFNSHGAFIKSYNSSEKITEICDTLSASRNQSLIRLPMFLLYVTFYVMLLKDKQNALTQKPAIKQ